MNIAYFITGLGLGGAEVVTLDIAGDMARRGHDVTVVYLTGENAHTIPAGVRAVGLGMHKTPAGILKALKQARRIVRDLSPDIVHGNMVHANIFARLLRLSVKLPALICSEHTQCIGRRVRMWAYRLTDRLSDLNTNVSQLAVDEFIRCKVFRKRNASTVYNGIDMRRFTPDKEARKRIRAEYGIADDEFLWLNVGRLTEAKDQANLLMALKRVGRGRLMILGKGELRDALVAQAGALGLSDRVILPGAHTNVADYYNAADCFVLSSAWEGFSVALLEAMSCGLPVIATDVSGASEALQGARFIVPVHRDDLLAAKMEDVYGLTDVQRREIGGRNRSLASRFDRNAIMGQWESIYKGLLRS